MKSIIKWILHVVVIASDDQISLSGQVPRRQLTLGWQLKLLHWAKNSVQYLCLNWNNHEYQLLIWTAKWTTVTHVIFKLLEFVMKSLHLSYSHKSQGQGHLMKKPNFATWTSMDVMGLKAAIHSLTWFDLSEVKVIQRSNCRCLTFYQQAEGGPLTERHSSLL